jgi:DNA-binding CsgD family transcriptional regulator/ABC-type phosphate/phosphonate transport system substrate-binding protein
MSPILVLLLLLLSPLATAAQLPPGGAKVVHIGVLAFNGEARTQSRWHMLADYLGAGIPGYRFEIEPLTHEGFRNRIRKGQLDFILTNPAHYVSLEVNFGATRLATFRSRYRDQALTRFGSVIFTLSNSKIHSLQDLRGHRFAAVNAEAFGGFLLARKRLLDADINALNDLQLLWLGFPQNEIVQAVLEGRADAGTVRTGVLEAMIDDGRLQPDQVRVLGARKEKDFPLRLSTQLYPEWPFARLPHTDRELARLVTVRLLQMPGDSAVARATGGAGWTIPLDYSEVRNTLRQLQIEPYVPRPLSLSELWRSHASAMVMLLLVISLIIATSIYILRINHRLKASQQALTHSKEELENLVEHRTSALIAANEALQKDIESRIRYEETLHGGCECMQGIHALIIRDDLSREQRLQSILDQLQQYFGAEQILLSRVDNQSLKHCAASPPLPESVPGLQPDLARCAIDRRSQVEEELVGMEKPSQHYLAWPVVRQGEVVCLIEFLCNAGRKEEARLSGTDELGMRILQLVAHWLAHENDALAREAQKTQAAQHLAGLTPREREVLIEVAGGSPNKLIARNLGISIKTVELHRSNLMRKLEITSAAELARLAMQAGIIDMEEDNLE